MRVVLKDREWDQKRISLTKRKSLVKRRSLIEGEEFMYSN